MSQKVPSIPQFCLIRHELKNNHNVGRPENGLYRTFAPGIILRKDNCQKSTRRSPKRPKKKNSTLFNRKRIGGRVSTGWGRGFSFRYNILKYLTITLRYWSEFTLLSLLVIKIWIHKINLMVSTEASWWNILIMKDIHNSWL